jgi:hypothetical protein
MMKKMMLVVVVAMTIMIAYYLYCQFFESLPNSNIVERNEQIKQAASPMKPIAVPTLVTEINARNEKVKTFVAEDVEIKVWQGGHRYRLNGSIHYEKPKNFRMIINSILGLEVDLGSNDKTFWYWSKRDKNPGLYWSAHEDFGKTRLKTPFNPIQMRGSLGFDIIDFGDGKTTDHGDTLVVTIPRRNGNNQPILYSIFLNKTTKQIDGFIVTDPAGKYLVACEIQARNGDLPQKILYTWYEEDRVMLLNLRDGKTNVAINAVHWTMPDKTPKINMAEK